MARTFTFRVDEEIRDRLEELAKRFRVPVRRKKSHREANLSEMLNLAAEYLLNAVEAGEDVISTSRRLPSTLMLTEGPDGEMVVTAMAPPASAEAYAALETEGRLPTADELLALENDIDLLFEGTRVRMRGNLFSDPKGERPELPDDRPGELVSARGKLRHKVLFEGDAEPTTVHPFDLVPVVERPGDS